MRTILPTFFSYCPHCGSQMTFSTMTNDRGDEIGKFCILCEWWIITRLPEYQLSLHY